MGGGAEGGVGSEFKLSVITAREREAARESVCDLLNLALSLSRSLLDTKVVTPPRKLYRDTSLMRKCLPIGPYSRRIHRALFTVEVLGGGGAIS